MDESTEVEVVPEQELYPWAKDDDEKRRAFIFEFYANADIDGPTLVRNMDLVAKWLKSGEIPTEKTDKVKLRSV